MVAFRRREFFRITKYARRYDRREGKFTIDVSYETAAEISPRTTAVADAFGLGIDEEQKFVIYDNVEFKIGPKDIVYITGDSGSGKSVLLKEIKKDLGDKAVDIWRIAGYAKQDFSSCFSLVRCCLCALYFLSPASTSLQRPSHWRIWNHESCAQYLNIKRFKSHEGVTKSS